MSECVGYVCYNSVALYSRLQVLFVSSYDSSVVGLVREFVFFMNGRIAVIDHHFDYSCNRPEDNKKCANL